MIPSALTPTVLSQQDAAFYEQNGYLLIEGALAPNLLDELKAATDALYVRAEQHNALEPQGKLNLRNCIVHHDAFLQLLDHPTTAPLAWQILGWNIQHYISHLIVYPPEAERSEVNLGSWHQGSGRPVREMERPHPRSSYKVSFWFSDTRVPNSGTMRIIPGSRNIGSMRFDSPAANGRWGRPEGLVATDRCGCAPQDVDRDASW